jgi:hypothetical protein
MIPGLLIGKHSSLTAGLCLATFFLCGMALGAGAAGEGTPYAAVEENVSGVSEEAIADLRANATGPTAPIAVGMAGMVAGSAETMVSEGAAVGYNYPVLGRTLGQVGPLALLLTMAGLAFVRVRRVIS